MRSTPFAVLLCVLLAGSLGCDQPSSSPGTAEPAPAQKQAPPAPPKAEAPKPPAPPAAEAPKPPAAPAQPAPATQASAGGGDPAKGEALYQTYCASCHGPRGAGDGPVAAGLNPKPASHNNGGYMNALTNEHLFKVVKLGGPAVGKSPLMAPWGGSLSDQQIWDLVAFMRTLAEPPYQGPKP